MKRYFVYFIVFVSVAFVGCSSTQVESDDASQSVDDGMPFGKITDNDTEQLMQFAKERGFDLSSELQKAYAKDTNALARIFRFSLSFKSLDQNARTYGQAIYSSLLNLGETIGPEQYSTVVVAQSPEVQQRVRDFLYFPVTRVPKRSERRLIKKSERIFRSCSRRITNLATMIHCSKGRPNIRIGYNRSQSRFKVFPVLPAAFSQSVGLFLR